MPFVDGYIHQGPRRNDDLERMAQRKPPIYDAAAQLRGRLLRSEAVLMMQMARERQEPISHCPVDRRPIIGQQQVGSPSCDLSAPTPQRQGVASVHLERSRAN